MAAFLPYSVAMVSPFTADGDFVPGDVEPLVRHHVAAGAPGLLICGSTVSLVHPTMHALSH